jgi:cytochrome c5
MKRVPILCLALVLTLTALAGSSNRKEPAAATAVVTHSPVNAETMRAQGEERFRANCGRCHAAPQKFPSRAMATVLRHMRVRATLTDEDMRLVLYYLTQ